jgi:hypothetical protein
MSAENPTPREFAALAYALALARGQLSSVSSGKFGKNEVRQVLEGTSAANIAAALGMKEADLAVDWSEYLSTAEMEKIRGARDD